MDMWTNVRWSYDPRVTEIAPLTGAERDWIDANLIALADEGVDVRDSRSVGSYYDQEFLAWSVTSEDKRPNPNPIINKIGIGLGACLNNVIGTTWAIAAEESGKELVVYRLANNVLIYPPNAVAKRWLDGHVGFVSDFVRGVIDRLAAL